MPKGEFTRPLGARRKRLSDPSGASDEMTRRAAASGDPKNYTITPMDPDEFAKQMRMRERGVGTAQNQGYAHAYKGLMAPEDPIDPNNPLNTTAPERKARAGRENSPFTLKRGSR
jgi:hypothetical protein